MERVLALQSLPSARRADADPATNAPTEGSTISANCSALSLNPTCPGAAETQDVW
jgi:hypothetical protein